MRASRLLVVLGAATAVVLVVGLWVFVGLHTYKLAHAPGAHGAIQHQQQLQGRLPEQRQVSEEQERRLARQQQQQQDVQDELPPAPVTATKASAKKEAAAVPLYDKTTPIPFLLHQTWKETAIAESIAANIRGWRALHPHWEYRFHTDDDNRRFIAKLFPEFLPLFDSYKAPIQRADAVRYFLLYEYGGVYMDLDFAALRPFDALLRQHNGSVILGQEPFAHAHVLNDIDRMLCNAWMAAPPKHPFWKAVIAEMTAKGNDESVLSTTGPKMLTVAMDRYEAEMKTEGVVPEDVPAVIIPAPEILFPWHDPYVEDMRRICHDTGKLSQRQKSACDILNSQGYQNPRPGPESFAVHQWIHTWHGHGGGLAYQRKQPIEEIDPKVVRDPKA